MQSWWIGCLVLIVLCLPACAGGQSDAEKPAPPGGAVGKTAGAEKDANAVKTDEAGEDDSAGKQDDTAAAKDEDEAEPVGLDGYVLHEGPTVMKGVPGDASGLTYCSATKSLFLVINSSSTIVELTLRGTVKREIATTGFVDVEGIAHVEGDFFCVVEEGRGTLCSVRIGKDTMWVDSRTGTAFTVDSSGRLGNKGLEGLAYDPDGTRFFAVKESRPRKIYEIDEPKWSVDRDDAKVTNPWDAQKNHLNMSDLSGIYYHRKSRHLLLLSHESFCVVEATLDGTEVSRLSLKRGQAGLKATIPQAEGITMDDAGTLYICSEPNLFYVFKKKE